MKQTDLFLSHYPQDEHDALKQTLAYHCAEYTDAFLDLFEVIWKQPILRCSHWLRKKMNGRT